jgi:molecular chaperone DnaK (HSP70)
MASAVDAEGTKVVVAIDFGTTTTSVAWAIEPKSGSTLSPQLILYVHHP